ncbi:MAG: hypothetical protein EKK65_15105, partial [Lysobacterales bacterium]
MPSSSLARRRRPARQTGAGGLGTRRAGIPRAGRHSSVDRRRKADATMPADASTLFPTPLRRLLAAAVLALLSAAAPAAQQDLEALRLVALDYLRSRVGSSSADIRVDGTDPRLRLWACESPIEASLSPGSRLRGRTAVVLRCPAPAWKLVMSAQVSIQRSIVVAARPLVRGTLLTAADLQVAAVDEARAGDGWIEDPKPAIGRLL